LKGSNQIAIFKISDLNRSHVVIVMLSIVDEHAHTGPVPAALAIRDVITLHAAALLFFYRL